MSTAVGSSLAIGSRNGFAVAVQDYSELVKARVTTLVIVTSA